MGGIRYLLDEFLLLFIRKRPTFYELVSGEHQDDWKVRLIYRVALVRACREQNRKYKKIKKD